MPSPLSASVHLHLIVLRLLLQTDQGEATITLHGRVQKADVLPPPSPLPHSAPGTTPLGATIYATRRPTHVLLCPQVPSPPSPTWPRAWPGTWTGSRWMRSTTTGRRSGGGSSRRASARGSGRACPGWASACSVRGRRGLGPRTFHGLLVDCPSFCRDAEAQRGQGTHSGSYPGQQGSGTGTLSRALVRLRRAILGPGRPPLPAGRVPTFPRLWWEMPLCVLAASVRPRARGVNTRKAAHSCMLAEGSNGQTS